MAQQGQYPLNQIHHSYDSYLPPPQYPPPFHPPENLTPPFPQFHQHPDLQPLPYHHHPHQYLPPPYASPQAHLRGPIVPPAHPHHDQPRSSGKRSREAAYDSVPGGEAGEVSSPKRKKGQDVLFRIVVPSRQIGKVIGKEGSRIQKIREETKASIKIADAVARYEERVIIISSKECDGGVTDAEKRYEERVIIISSKECDGGVTDAEKALQKICNLILQDDGTGAAAVNAGPVSAANPLGGTDAAVNASGGVGPAHVAANTVRLLIAGSQAGGLIGVSGQNIEKLRNLSGATITVLAPNQLPFCASAHESDRLVQISGDVPAVLKAVEETGSHLRENPPKQVISISPAYNYSTVQTAQQFLDPSAAECVTMDMVISETMVGGLIGRCGANIARIRNESGAMIKVHGGKGEQKHRQIHLSGSPQQVALAKQRVDEYIYSQLTQPGSHPPP